MKNPLNLLGKKIATFFHNPKKYIHIAVFAVQKLKEAIDSQWLTSIVQLTDNKVDDALLSKIRIALTEALYAVELIDAINQAPLTQAQSTLEPMTKEGRGEKYELLAGHLLSNLSGLPVETAIQKAKEYYNSSEFVFYKEV